MAQFTPRPSCATPKVNEKTCFIDSYKIAQRLTIKNLQHLTARYAVQEKV
jgi:hypothetical protein